MLEQPAAHGVREFDASILFDADGDFGVNYPENRICVDPDRGGRNPGFFNHRRDQLVGSLADRDCRGEEFDLDRYPDLLFCRDGPSVGELDEAVARGIGSGGAALEESCEKTDHFQSIVYRKDMWLFGAC
mgnify:CR=1 FL=1